MLAILKLINQEIAYSYMVKAFNPLQHQVLGVKTLGTLKSHTEPRIKIEIYFNPKEETIIVKGRELMDFCRFYKSFFSTRVIDL